jgi:outer membrane protein assembly factor BamB
LTASDAVSGERKWQFHAPFPLMSGVTPTNGGLLLFGDMGGTFYAFEAVSGKKLWSADLGGAIAGGVITYDSGQGQRIAVARGHDVADLADAKGQRQSGRTRALSPAQGTLREANSSARPTIGRSFG